MLCGSAKRSLVAASVCVAYSVGSGHGRAQRAVGAVGDDAGTSADRRHRNQNEFSAGGGCGCQEEEVKAGGVYPAKLTKPDGSYKFLSLLD